MDRDSIVCVCRSSLQSRRQLAQNGASDGGRVLEVVLASKGLTTVPDLAQV